MSLSTCVCGSNEPPTMPERLRSLSINMTQIGMDLTRMGGEPAEHGVELIGAAGMCPTWADGIDGGFVVCGQRTSKMSKAEFSNLLELIYAFGAEHEVTFSEPVMETSGPDRNPRQTEEA